MSGCGLGMMEREGTDRALFLDMIIDLKNPRYQEGVDSQTKGKAYSCIAQVYLQRHRELPVVRLDSAATPNDLSDNLYQAARHADASARCGYIPSVVCYISSYLHGLSDKFPIDMSKTARFGEFDALWRVCEQQHAEAQEEERQRQRKLKKAPNAYACAAPGCGVRAVKKAACSACAGRCPPDLKPHYCIKKCQVKVCA